MKLHAAMLFSNSRFHGPIKHRSLQSPGLPPGLVGLEFRLLVTAAGSLWNSLEIGDPHCNAGLSMLAYALARIRDFEAGAHPIWTPIGGTLKSYREKERVKSVIAIKLIVRKELRRLWKFVLLIDVQNGRYLKFLSFFWDWWILMAYPDILQFWILCLQQDPVLLKAVLDRSVVKMEDFGPTDAAKCLSWKGGWSWDRII